MVKWNHAVSEPLTIPVYSVERLRSMGKYKAPPPDKFIKIWEEAETIEEVVAELGLEKDKPQAAYLTAAMYRKNGIPLKEFEKKTTPKKPTLNVEEALKAYAKIKGTTVGKAKVEGEKVKAAIQKRLAAKKAAKQAASTTTTSEDEA